MAVTDQQKLDFLLKKIGYTKTKTGSVVGTGAISGTPKQPFAEAIPSPLVVPNSSLWNEAGSIPATAPGSDTVQVKVYSTTSALRMTADATSSGQRAYIAYTTYNNTSSARLTNWIDTQFGASYLIKVYKGDPNSGGVALSAAGSGANDGWFFDYSAGVLNFNDTSVPSGVTDTNIYIVGYRYIGQTGAPTSGISTFSNLDLTVERNLDVGKQGGISTFRHNVQLLDNDRLQFGDTQDLQIYHFSATNNNFISGQNNADITISAREIELMNQNHSSLYFKGTESGSIVYHNNTARVTTTSTGINVSGNNVVSGNISAVDGTFTGNVSIAGTLTYEDAKNVDSVGLITARSGIRVTGGVIEAQAGENKIPSLYAAMGNLPSAGSYHGMFAHVHATGRGYFAHAGNWLELVNREINGVVGTGTETYNIGNLVSTSSTATSLNVSGVTTAVTLDVNGDLDVDGHTNLDNVSIVGVTTFTGNAIVDGVLTVKSGNETQDRLQIGDSGQLRIYHAGHNYYRSQSGNHIFTVNGSEVAVSMAPNAGVSLWYDGVRKFRTTSSGVEIEDTTTSAQLAITGVSTFTGAVDANGDLDVDGHTNLDNVSIAGVTTTTEHINIDADDKALRIGDSQDIQIFHNSTASGGRFANSSYIENNTGNLFIRGVVGTIIGSTAGEIYGQFLKADKCELRFNNNVKFVTTNTGIDVTGNVVSDGLVVDGDSDLNGDLDVDGHTNLDNVSVAGVTTFAANTRFNSSITAGGGTGSNGQYLKTTGSGVEWATFPSLRTSQTFTASAGQTTFSFTYTVGLVDVFVNGIKLANSEYTATNGSTVVLAVGSFVGDIVELNNYNTVSAGGGAGGISNLVEDTTPQLGGNLDLFNKSITGTGNVNITGIITATNFIGNGSGLTGIVASGSGVVVKNSGSTVGTAGTINFGDNLSVSPASAGIVTITAVGITTNSGVISIENDLDVDGHTNLDNVSIAGVATVTGALRIPDGAKNGNRISVGDSEDLKIYHNGGHNYIDSANGNLTIRGANDENAILYTANGSIELFHDNVKRFETSSVGVSIPQDLDVDGHTNLDNVSISGVTTFTGVINGSQLSLSGTSGIRADSLNLLNAAGSASYAVFTNGGSAVLKHNNTNRLETSASGVSVTGTVAATSYTGDGSQLTGIVAGITTISGVVNVANDLDVDGHTNLDNVSVAGVVTATTFVGALTGNVTGNTSGSSGSCTGTSALATEVTLTDNNSQNETTYITFADGRTGSQGLETEIDLTYNPSTGNLSATKFTGDGSGLTGITASGSGVVIKNSGSTVGTAGTINFGNNLSVSAISGGAVTITATGGSGSGISTISGVVNIANDLDVDGHTNLDNVSIAGVSTFTGDLTVDTNTFHVDSTNNRIGVGIITPARKLQIHQSDSTANYLHVTNDTTGSGVSDGALFGINSLEEALIWNQENDNIIFGTNNTHRLTLNNSGHLVPAADGTYDLGLTGTRFSNVYADTLHGQLFNGVAATTQAAGNNTTRVATTAFVTTAVENANVGITTNLSGTFTASAGSAATINTFGYGSGDLVVEYTIYIKNGSDFQTQKLLAMRDGTTIHSTQFAVMFSSSLLVQCDATISSGNILLRATPETGVSGSTTYKIKREVM